MKILLVEDNDILRKLQADTFQKLGHKVATAPSGQKAIEALKHISFDLILMDLVMPEMDGFETTRLILQQPSAPPIIALTGNDDEQIKQDCFDAGMVAFLTKPTDSKTFTSVVEQIFK